MLWNSDRILGEVGLLIYVERELVKGFIRFFCNDISAIACFGVYLF